MEPTIRSNKSIDILGETEKKRAPNYAIEQGRPKTKRSDGGFVFNFTCMANKNPILFCHSKIFRMHWLMLQCYTQVYVIFSLCIAISILFTLHNVPANGMCALAFEQQNTVNNVK